MSTFGPSPSSSSGFTTMRPASTATTVPSRLATTVTPESRATTASMPVPTSGASVRSSGTAWRCMFAPISARFASSFSRKGTSEAATDTSWFGDTSIIWTSSAFTSWNSPILRPVTVSFTKRLLASSGAFACAIASRSSSSAERYFTSAVTFLSVHHAVRRLDEAEVVHARVGRERRDQADVRPFRRLDRADAAVVRRVHVAHLEAGALAREAARPERREAALVRHRRERVGLVHELRELARAEELLDHRRDGLGVDQVVRHQRLDLLERHALLDRPLHAHQADPVLVLEQLADHAHAAVAEVVDVVDALVRVGAVLQVDQVLHRLEDVLGAQRRELAERDVLLGAGRALEPHQRARLRRRSRACGSA